MSRLTLVHGTSAKYLDSILANGIEPRNNRASNWECASNPRMVYLSKCYALYYAMQAANVESGDDAVMFEVQVPMWKLYPDEDFMAHCMNDNFKSMYPKLVERTMACREVIDDMTDSSRHKYLKLCLNYLGNAAHLGVISPRMITRVAVIPQKDFARIILSKYDPCPIPLNYAIMGKQHIATQNEIFEEYRIGAKA